MRLQMKPRSCKRCPSNLVLTALVYETQVQSLHSSFSPVPLSPILVSTCLPFCPLSSVVSPSKARSLFPSMPSQPQVEPWYQPAQPIETGKTRLRCSLLEGIYFFFRNEDVVLPTRRKKKPFRTIVELSLCDCQM